MSSLKLLFVTLLCASCTAWASQPNILWISTEDMGPHLGAYGDPYAISSKTSPNIDAFAKEGLRYDKVSSNGPVCSVARTTLISGIHATTTGSYHHRSQVPAPDWMNFFPFYLKQAGYYTTNNKKQDYNLLLDDLRKGWDESSDKAHWKNRPDGKPFFAVFNYEGTHENQIRNKNPHPYHDPKKIILPAYYPDTPESRKDWAQYYDRIKQLDVFFQARIDELKAANLYDDTIIFFWGDHGPGLPRNKRFPGWSGLHVPLIIRIPEKYRQLAPKDFADGSSTDRLVSFIDFAPTVLSIANISIPEHFQGNAFLGKKIAPPKEYLYGYRGRMDESYDNSRSITDGQLMYIRNFLPFFTHGQDNTYQQKTPSAQVWKNLYDNGQLNAVQSQYWSAHPFEELFDLAMDPDEINNLANDPSYESTLHRLRAAMKKEISDSADSLYWPEPTFSQALSAGKLSAQPPLSEWVFDSYTQPLPSLKEFKSAPDEKKYWYLIQLRNREIAYKNVLPFLNHALNAKEKIVQITAAEHLALLAPKDAERAKSLKHLRKLYENKKSSFLVRVYSLMAIKRIHEAGFDIQKSIKGIALDNTDAPAWGKQYIPDLIGSLRSN